MGLDAISKRWSPAVLVLLVAAIAYFQAVALGQLLSTALLVARPPAPLANGRPPVHDADADHVTSAREILARNPFDSTTGPLGDDPVGPTLPAASPAAPDRDPYTDPPCAGARAVLIAGSDDAAWSFAAIVGADGKPVLRRSGGEIDGKTVLFVGDLRPGEHRHRGGDGLSDRVWLSSGAARCQLALGTKAAKPDGPTPQTGAQGLATKIHPTGEHAYAVDRSVIDALMANPAELMKARITPAKEGDRVVGMNVFGVRPGSLLAAIGLENGDRLTAINGFEMNDPQKMLEAYAKLARADHLTASVIRGGKPMSLDLDIR